MKQVGASIHLWERIIMLNESVSCRKINSMYAVMLFFGQSKYLALNNSLHSFFLQLTVFGKYYNLHEESRIRSHSMMTILVNVSIRPATYDAKPSGNPKIN